MGFEPQTADKPLINVKKKTTKVNLVIIVAVIVFFVIAIAGGMWASRTSARGGIESPTPNPPTQSTP